MENNMNCPFCGSELNIDPQCTIVSPEGREYIAPAALCSGCEFCIEITPDSTSVLDLDATNAMYH